ncbi:hypothetical protein AAP_00315 [Ascosphaera apis ARSEF 7405]|uniref:Uncharacterized protein n=1 Tax=Ascosphaera apis ARSEF 7405 TaxID=392613 RepID=A0A168DSA4_9EURO|nr:hypothetical protein AAP_00315 [Ascosphaera apis ARSEF 7405]
MEAASLTQAHIHARNAHAETERSNPVAASEEHDLAAAEFAAAAANCSDAQALRVLHLLEQHHKRLAEVIKFQHEHRNSKPRQDDHLSRSPAASDPPAKTPVSELSDTPSVSTPHANIRGHSRLGRSIASDLASARGIRRENATPARTNDRIAEVHHKRRNPPTSSKSSSTHDASHNALPSRPKPSWAPALEPPGVSNAPEPSRARREASIKADIENDSIDDPFNRFYSSFGGLISKISAPLAFAGLPLGNEPKSTPPTGHNRAASDLSCQSNVPDLTKLLSPAAIRAIKDDNDSKLPVINPMESFYVVPTTGGTMSYAGIVAGKEKRIGPDADPEFELERALKNLREDYDQERRDHEKTRRELKQYIDKWESLKASARSRPRRKTSQESGKSGPHAKSSVMNVVVEEGPQDLTESGSGSVARGVAGRN